MEGTNFSAHVLWQIKLKEGKLGKKEILHYEDGEAPAEVAQRSCGNSKGQVG